MMPNEMMSILPGTLKPSESGSRHSFSTAVALCEGWLASAEALYERRIKHEESCSGQHRRPPLQRFNDSSTNGRIKREAKLAAMVRSKAPKKKRRETTRREDRQHVRFGIASGNFRTYEVAIDCQLPSQQ
jgi:hypothetical protein